MFCEGLKVLHDGGKVELVARPTEASQTQALEAMVGLQVGEAHFHSFPLIAEPLVLRRIDEGTGTVTGSSLTSRAGYFAPRDAWATLHLHRASIAIELARRYRIVPPVMHPAGRPQDLAIRVPVLFFCLSNVKALRENVPSFR